MMLPVGSARNVQRVAKLGIGGRARVERTENMRVMFVASDVSNLSGWLNADAFCQFERRIEIDGM